MCTGAAVSPGVPGGERGEASAAPAQGARESLFLIKRQLPLTHPSFPLRERDVSGHGFVYYAGIWKK